MTKCYLLDACALIAYINDEAGADIVDDLLMSAADGTVLLSMSIVNILEVYYGVCRDFGADNADDVLNEILTLPLNVIDDLSIDVLREAGRLKAKYSISLADSVALGIASVRSIEIVTADHHEMDVVEGHEPIQFKWIR